MPKRARGKSDEGPKREDGYLLHVAGLIEFRGFVVDGGVDVYTFIEGDDEATRLYGISENICGGLRRMFKEWHGQQDWTPPKVVESVDE